MRQRIVAGNWKMHTLPKEGLELAKKIADGAKGLAAELWIFPPATHLASISEALPSAPFQLGAQDASAYGSGAYTGEIAVSMLKACGAKGLLIGHSERRQLHGEGGELLQKKVALCLEEGLVPFLCVGETLEQRESGMHMEEVRRQVEEAVEGLESAPLGNLVVAYEPVWAIGTGKTASPFQAQEMHAFIRRVWTEKFGKEAAGGLRILYGGSVKEENAADLFAQADIDGGLIGGASLQADSFLKIASYASGNGV